MVFNNDFSTSLYRGGPTIKRKRKSKKQGVFPFEEYLRVALTERRKLFNIEPDSQEGKEFLFVLAVGYTVQYNIHQGKTGRRGSEDVRETVERVSATSKLATSTGEWVASILNTPCFDLTERISICFRHLIAGDAFIVPHIDEPTKQPWMKVTLGQPRPISLN